MPGLVPGMTWLNSSGMTSSRLPRPTAVEVDRWQPVTLNQKTAVETLLAVKVLVTGNRVTLSAALRLALLDHPRILPQLDRLVRVHLGRLLIDAAGDQQIRGTRQYVIGARCCGQTLNGRSSVIACAAD
jgi:hypothetical protein